MSLLQELEYERNKYYRLLDDINSIYTNIENCVDNLDSADLELSRYYVINNESADDKKINNTIKSLSSTKEVLKDTIIPAINSKIAQLNDDIAKQGQYEGF